MPIDLQPIVLQFASIEERNYWIPRIPGKPTNTPGVYEVKGWGYIQVFVTEVTLVPNKHRTRKLTLIRCAGK